MHINATELPATHESSVMPKYRSWRSFACKHKAVVGTTLSELCRDTRILGAAIPSPAEQILALES